MFDFARKFRKNYYFQTLQVFFLAADVVTCRIFYVVARTTTHFYNLRSAKAKSFKTLFDLT